MTPTRASSSDGPAQVVGWREWVDERVVRSSSGAETLRPVIRTRAGSSGVVIGRRVNPLVHQGEAVVHLARAAPPEERRGPGTKPAS